MLKKFILLFLILFCILLYPIDKIATQDNVPPDNYTYWFGSEYRANRFYTDVPCTLKVLYVGRYTKKDEIDTLFVWGGYDKDTLLYYSVLNVNTNNVGQIVSDTVTTLIELRDHFWIGSYSRTQDNPSNALSYVMGDSIGKGISYYKNDSSWIQNNITDYIFRAKIAHSGLILLLNPDPIYINKDIIFNQEEYSMYDINGRRIYTKPKRGIYFIKSNLEIKKILILK